MQASAEMLVEEQDTHDGRITRSSIADIAVISVLLVIAALGWMPIYDSPIWILSALGGLALGTAVVVVGQVLRLQVLTIIALALAAYFLLGTAFALPGEGIFGVIPSLQSLADLAVAPVFGWSDTVTLRTPIGQPAYLFALPFFSTWAASLVSTLLALRFVARRRSFWRASILLIVPTLLYVAVVLLGTEAPFWPILRGVLAAVIAVAWLGWQRVTTTAGDARARRDALVSRLIGAGVLVLVAVVAGGLVASVTAPPVDRRVLVRHLVQPPFDPAEYPSPLAGFRHYTKEVNESVVMKVGGLESNDRIRIATMDSFDGKIWTVTGHDVASDGSGAFGVVGSTFPQPKMMTPGRNIRLTVSLKDYQGVWLPVSGYPRSVDLTGGALKSHRDDVRYNDVTGTTAVTSQVRSGDAYSVAAVAQKDVPASRLKRAQPAEVQLPSIPQAPADLVSRMKEYTQGIESPYAKVKAIEQKLKANGYLSHGTANDQAPSRAGQGYDRLQDLFGAQNMVGDQEQYASAMAVMVRQMGYPSRVVMGFSPKVATGSNDVDVHGADVDAWVEVPFDGIGWVAFDPTPTRTDVPQNLVPKPMTTPQPQVQQPPREDKKQDDLATTDDKKKNRDKQDDGFALPTWVIVTGIIVLGPLLLLAAIAGLIALWKWRRRKRRRTGRGDLQVANGWQEVVDTREEYGQAVPRHETRLREAQLVDPALVPLAQSTDCLVFGGQEVSQQDADAYWGAVRDDRDRVRAASSKRARILAMFRIARKRGAKRVTASWRMPRAVRRASRRTSLALARRRQKTREKTTAQGSRAVREPQGESESSA